MKPSMWIAAAGVALALCAACAPNETRQSPATATSPGVEESMAPDDMPPTGTSGLGTPGGHEDAGLPRVPLDGSIPHGGWDVP